MVGQRFATLLAEHPWFEVACLAASPRSSGLSYEEAVGDRWKLEEPMPEKLKKMVVKDVSKVEDVVQGLDFVFSAVDMKKEEIKAIEEAYAKAEVPVVSNNSAHRWTEDVPMVVPEINPEHYQLIEKQRKRLGTKRGFIAVKPNCSIQSYAPALAAWAEYEPYECVISTYQAISGAGKNFETWPEMVGNIIPYIGGEEEKSEKEPLRVLGTLTDKGIQLKEDLVISAQCIRVLGTYTEDGIKLKEGLVLSAQCIRVPVLNGHTATVSIRFRKKVTKDELIAALRNYKGLPQEKNLPSAPKQFIQYLEEDNRPSVLTDVNFEKGMGISIGRLREDNLFDFKFVGLSHNTLRGAAGGGVLSAETLVELGYIQKR